MYLLSPNQHIDRLLRTTKSTLILNPEVGLSPVYLDRSVLPEDYVLDLKEEILENLENFEPRISPKHLSVRSSEGKVELVIKATDIDKVVPL